MRTTLARAALILTLAAAGAGPAAAQSSSLEELLALVAATNRYAAEGDNGDPLAAHQAASRSFDGQAAGRSGGLGGIEGAAPATNPGSSPSVHVHEERPTLTADKTAIPAPKGGADARVSIVAGALEGTKTGAAMGGGLTLTPAKWIKDAGYDMAAGIVGALLIVPSISMAITGAVLGLFYGAFQGGKS